MANLSITLRCNRACAYCFARGAADASGDMPWSLYQTCLDWLRRSGRDQVRLLGGEPTLHPDFPGMVREALDRGLRVLVFSNGIMPPAALEALAMAPPERAGVLVNLNAPGVDGPAVRQRQQEVLGRLGGRAMVGFNLHQANPRMEFLLPVVERLGLARRVRLGLAHPVPGGGNASLHPKKYPAVGRAVARFAREAWERRIELEFDCGFVPCMFPDWFWDLPGAKPDSIGPRCGAAPDVLPDGRVAACYPLARQWSRAPDWRQSASRMVEGLRRDMEHLRQMGIYAHCRICSWREQGRCLGGCLGAALTRLRRAARPETEVKS